MWDVESDVGLSELDFKQLNESIKQLQQDGRSSADCHTDYVRLVKQKLQDKGLDPEAVIDSHKKLMYYAAVLSEDSFSSLWNDVQAAAAAAEPKEGEDQHIWDAPAAEGENDDEDCYE